MDDLPVFRVNKRRKFTRSRAVPAEDDTETSQVSPGREASESTNDDGVNVSNLLKQRKQTRQRGTGVQFSQQKRTEHNEDNDEMAKAMVLAVTDPDEERLKDISNRFVGSTGQVVDVDKHMMAYIDSQMAQSRSAAAAREASEYYTDPDSDEDPSASAARNQPSTSQIPSQHQLSEVDLGPGVHATNLARTEAAIARAQSGLPPPTEEPKPRRPRKPRLGRDGKPMRPRPRRRRNSEDAARDALVEQMLREHRVEAPYDGAESAGPANATAAADDGGDADERLAEQFRQNFMDAMAERRQRSQVKAAAAARAKGVGTESSGPKLGGGRSARAKMAQLQQQQKKSVPGQK